MPPTSDRRPIHELGAAVIGSGFIGTVHIDALRRLGVAVRGILGSAPDRAGARAAQLGIARAYRSLDELLADEAVDVVHVTSPNRHHHAQVAAILGSGKHVVCEKPLAMTSAESAELVALAARTGLVNAVNFNIRYYPVNQHLAAEVAAGALGEIRLVTGHYLQDWLLLPTDWNWRLVPEEGGELRAVGDIGSHWLDLTSHVTGLHVTEVMADLATFVPVRQEPAGPVETFSTDRSGRTLRREIRTEDAATILLRYANGARGLVAVSQVSPGRKNSLQYEIDGSAGAAAWESERPDELWLGRRDEANRVLLRNPALLNERGAATASLPGGHAEGFADTFRALYRAVYADVAAGAPSERPAYPTFADGHEEMRIGDAIAESARTGRWTAVAG